jgi:hypothetical protein
MLKISKNNNFRSVIFLKEINKSDEIFGNDSFVEMEFSKLINYSNKHVVLKGPRYGGK